MKFVFGALFLFLSFNVFAGPEEHKALQSCYGLDARAETVPNSVPGEICLERIQVDVSNQQISVESYFQPQLFQGLELTHLSRKNEDWYLFQASKFLVNKMNPGCMDGESVELKVSGRLDNSGESNPAELALSVVHVATNDTCHSRAQSTTYNYHLQ